MSDAKAIRKQVRNVVKEVLPDVMKSVVVEEFQKQIQETLNTRLDSMNQYCVDQLTKQDKRARDVQGFLMREVRVHIRNTMNDMDVTIEALMKVLGDSGIVIDNFVEKVNAAKPLIIQQREEEAKAKMEAELKGQQESESTSTEQEKE